MSWMIVLAIPIGVLFGTLMAFGNLSSKYEITVMKSGGMSLIKMMYPLIIAGMFLSYALFWFNDNILPDTNHKAKVLLADVSRKKPTFSIEAGQFTTDIEGYTILSRTLDSTSGVLKGVTIYDNSSGQRVNLASADSGTIEFSNNFSKLIIFLKHGEIHQLINGISNDYRKIEFDKYQIVVSASGFAFERSADGMISRGDRELRISDMQKEVNDAESNIDSAEKRIRKRLNEHYDFLAGEMEKADMLEEDSVASIVNWEYGLREAEKRCNYINATIVSDINQANDYAARARQFEVEIYKKYAIPFGCFLFVIVGCPLGIITKRGNFGISAGISLIFYVFSWISLIGGEKLADRGFLSPFLSMWLGNITLGIVGIIIMIRVSNEGFRFRNFRLFNWLLNKN